jgi:hypothetical protein
LAIKFAEAGYQLQPARRGFHQLLFVVNFPSCYHFFSGDYSGQKVI